MSEPLYLWLLDIQFKCSTVLNNTLAEMILATMGENLSGTCEQQRRRPPCASAQSDQHLCCLLKSIISKLATSEISFLQLVSVTEEAGLSLALLETQKTDLVALRYR